MQVKTTMKCHLTSVKMTTVKKKKSVDKNVKKWSLYTLLVGMYNGAATMRNS